MTAPLPSQRTIDFTVECEVSSRAYYEKHYQRPEWPGGASGVTVGIGYDLGYASRDKIRRDWSQHVPAGMLSVMLRCAGVTGEEARSLCAQVRAEILIPWDAAMAVFAGTDVPEYTAGIVRAIPEAEHLPPDCLGVLFSIGYNRGNGGWTSDKDRYREMRAIRGLVQNGELDAVAPQIRRMARLWPSDDPGRPDRGLRKRREAEAALWDQGLKKSQPAAASVAANPAPARTLPTQAGAAKEAAGAGAVVVATAATAQQAHAAGWTTPMLLVVAAAGIGVALLVATVINRMRAPTIARAKDIGEPT